MASASTGTTTGRKNRLALLLVSDIHVSLSNIHDLADWLVQHKKNHLDFVLLSGDLVSLSNEDMQKPERVNAAEGEMSAVLHSLENIHPQVIYIPGNHDSPSTLKRGAPQCPQLTPLSQNIHECLIEIAPNLVVAGFGGSVNGYYADTGERKWIGFPFQQESQMRDRLHLLRKTLQEQIPLNDDDGGNAQSSNSPPSSPDRQAITATNSAPRKSVILMTHCGPSGLDTVKIQPTIEDRLIVGGSDSLKEFLSDQYIQQTVFLNIHGHTHLGAGISNLGRITVLNPGALIERRAAILTLHYSEITQQWSIESMELIILPLF